MKCYCGRRLKLVKHALPARVYRCVNGGKHKDHKSPAELAARAAVFEVPEISLRLLAQGNDHED